MYHPLVTVVWYPSGGCLPDRDPPEGTFADTDPQEGTWEVTSYREPLSSYGPVKTLPCPKLHLFMVIKGQDGFALSKCYLNMFKKTIPLLTILTMLKSFHF